MSSKKPKHQSPQEPKTRQQFLANKPCEATSKDAEECELPRAIHLVVGYRDSNQNNTQYLTPGQIRLVEYIKQEYEIPPDFESNVRKFGPLSGLTYEERLISSYEWGLLQKKCRDAGGRFCWKCEQMGNHFARQGCNCCSRRTE